MTTTTDTDNRARADAARARATATLRVRPPADGDVTAGCGLCGVRHVLVPGGRTFTSTARREVPADSPLDTGAYAKVGDDGRLVHVTAVDAVQTAQARDLDRDTLARQVWTRVIVPRSGLDLPGGGNVTLWLCAACEGGRDRFGRAFGRPLVERLLVAAGWPLRLEFGHGLASIRRLTYAGRVLDARAAGRPEPAAGATGWDHVPAGVVHDDGGWPAPGETRDTRLAT